MTIANRRQNGVRAVVGAVAQAPRQGGQNGFDGLAENARDQRARARLLAHRERPGTVILTLRVVCARRNLRSSTSTACLRRILPTMRGTGLGWQDRSSATPGRSMSTPSSAAGSPFEYLSRSIS